MLSTAGDTNQRASWAQFAQMEAETKTETEAEAEAKALWQYVENNLFLLAGYKDWSEQCQEALWLVKGARRLLHRLWHATPSEIHLLFRQHFRFRLMQLPRRALDGQQMPAESYQIPQVICICSLINRFKTLDKASKYPTAFKYSVEKLHCI